MLLGLGVLPPQRELKRPVRGGERGHQQQQHEPEAVRDGVLTGLREAAELREDHAIDEVQPPHRAGGRDQRGAVGEHLAQLRA